MRAAWMALVIAVALACGPGGGDGGGDVAERGGFAVQPQGGELFQTTCGPCHTQAQALELAGKHASREQLDAVLSDHHAKEAATRAAIVDYLLAQLGPS